MFQNLEDDRPTALGPTAMYRNRFTFFYQYVQAYEPNGAFFFISGYEELRNGTKLYLHPFTITVSYAWYVVILCAEMLHGLLKNIVLKLLCYGP